MVAFKIVYDLEILFGEDIQKPVQEVNDTNINDIQCDDIFNEIDINIIKDFYGKPSEMTEVETANTIKNLLESDNFYDESIRYFIKALKILDRELRRGIGTLAITFKEQRLSLSKMIDYIIDVINIHEESNLELVIVLDQMDFDRLITDYYLKHRISEKCPSGFVDLEMEYNVMNVRIDYEVEDFSDILDKLLNSDNEIAVDTPEEQEECLEGADEMLAEIDKDLTEEDKFIIENITEDMFKIRGIKRQNPFSE